MASDRDFREPPLGVGPRVWRSLRTWTPQRPVSFFLLIAITVALLFGLQFVYVRENPKQFAFLLSIYFVFFSVVIFRAILDAFDILREHIRERERVFRETFGGDEFAAELGERVRRADPDSWPES